jgi:hypothetical protein
MRLEELKKALKKRFGCDWSFEIDEKKDDLHVLRMENDDDSRLCVSFFIHDPEEENKRISIDIEGHTKSNNWVCLTIHTKKCDIEECLEKEQALWEAFQKLSSL